MLATVGCTEAHSQTLPQLADAGVHPILDPAYGTFRVAVLPVPSHWEESHLNSVHQFATAEITHSESHAGFGTLDLAVGGVARACVMDVGGNSGSRGLLGGGHRPDGAPGNESWQEHIHGALGLAGTWTRQGSGVRLSVGVAFTGCGARLSTLPPPARGNGRRYTFLCNLLVPTGNRSRMPGPLVACTSVGASPDGWLSATAPIGASGAALDTVGVLRHGPVWLLGASPGIMVHWNLPGNPSDFTFSVVLNDDGQSIALPR